MKRITLNLFCLTMALLLSNQSAEAQSKNESKFGKGLQFVAKDSSMAVKIQFRFQSLFVAEKELSNGTDWSSQYLIRRSRLKFGGWVLNPNVKYKLELGLTNSDISPKSDFNEVNQASRIVFDAVVKWKFAKNFELWVGQTKLPGNRERVISSQQLQFVDRSLVNSRYNLDRDVGLQLHSNFTLGSFIIKPKVAWSMGEGRNVTVGNIGGYDYTARIEFLPLGEFTSKGDYSGSDLKRETAPKLAIGVTYDFNNGASREGGQLGDFMKDSLGAYLTTDLNTVMVDVMFKYKGFSVTSEFASKSSSIDTIDFNGNQFRTGWGLVGQMGYLFKNNWEIATRYTYITPDKIIFSGVRETAEYTLGISKYFIGHSLKVQSDFSLVDQFSLPDPEFRFRLQVELAI